jgi:phosphatidylinositol-bisphosphatase
MSDFLPPGEASSPTQLRRLQDTPGGWPSSPSPSHVHLPESTAQSLSNAVCARKDEFTRKKTIKIKVGTWNVAAAVGAEKDLGGWFVDGKGDRTLSDTFEELSVDDDGGKVQKEVESVEDQESRRKRNRSTIPRNDTPAVPGGSDIDLYVLGLQEIIDISSASEALRPYLDPNPGKRWKEAIRSHLPECYEKVAEQQLLGMLILVFASAELASSISSVSATSVGTGLMGYMGNKGATSVRLVLGETTKLLFVNCHLSAGADKAALARRNWDASQIISRTKFTPLKDENLTENYGDSIGDEDFGFWFGDLNYRLEDIPGDDVRRLLLLHTRNEYDVENKSKRKIDTELGYVNASSGDLPADSRDSEEMISRAALDHAGVGEHIDPKSDPTSLHTTLRSLLPHDQLHNQMKLQHAFHEGWQEGEIGFLPTYKYDIGSVGMFDSGEKKRSPSWCDRILYRSRQNKLDAERRAKEQVDARMKDDEMKARGLDEAADENDVLFDYDPDTDGLADGDDYDEADDAPHDAEPKQIREGLDGSIIVNQYVSHQRVLSSDHKPLDAVFTLTYDAVVSDLKAKIHQEVARELDKAENENRPGVTVVVDRHSEETIEPADDSIEPHDLTSVDFGKIKYGFPIFRNLTIANTGQAPATFSFIDRPVAEGQKGGVAPSWLELQVEIESDNKNQNASALREYTISPGESTGIILKIDIVDLKMVHSLNTGKIRFEDVLVLRIIKGRDHFIPVKGAWLPSCLCRTLDELVSVPEGGVRSLTLAAESRSDGGGSDRPRARRTNTRHSAPKELFMLTEAIQDHAERSIAEWDMIYSGETAPWSESNHGTFWPFDSQTWQLPAGYERSNLVAVAIEALDMTSTFENVFSSEVSCLARLEVLVETLFIFLKSLRDGIVPFNLWSEMEAQLANQDKTKTVLSSEDAQGWIMEIMSTAPVHSVALTFVTFMLARIIDELVPPEEQLAAESRTPRPSSSSSRSEVSSLSATPTATSWTHSKTEGFLPSLRRRIRTGTQSSSEINEDTSVAGVIGRRKQIQQAYIDAFAGLVVRSDKDAVLKGKDKKSLDARKRRILEPFLITSGPA